MRRVEIISEKKVETGVEVLCHVYYDGVNYEEKTKIVPKGYNTIVFPDKNSFFEDAMRATLITPNI